MWTLFRYLPQLKSCNDKDFVNPLLSRRFHALGLNENRARYINSRVRLLSLLFAMLTPLWIPVDYFILQPEQFYQMTAVRLVFSLVLLLISGVSDSNVSFFQAQVRLVMLMVLPAVFHLVTQIILGDTVHNELLVFYSFLPFLIIVMHCIFPLTLLEGAGLAMLTITLLSLDELYRGVLFSYGGLAELWLMCLIMGVAIWAQLSQLHMTIKLFNEATTDPLTGVFNRRTLMEHLDHIKRQALRHGRPISLLMMDLDHFKQVNDNYGHHVGDQVLKDFAGILQQQVRSTDYVARFGGEEFVAILPEARPEEALLLAERILSGCREAVVELDDDRLVRYSVSIGVGLLDVDQLAEVSLSHTDAALYQAKQQGRDRAVMAG